MPRVIWQLERNRPVVKIQLVATASDPEVTRTLLADTGAGGFNAPFELILSTSDCQRYMGLQSGYEVALGGAIVGAYPIYAIRIEIPMLSWSRRVQAVAVPDTACPAGFDGVACFRFLNLFTYGNFGDQRQFGLENLA
jgi:hypothetical protein